MEDRPAAAAAATRRSPPCSCSEGLGGPLSPGSLERRRTLYEGEALLSPRKRAALRLGASLRAWAALSPDPREEEEEDEARGSELLEIPRRARRALSLPEGGCCHKCKKRVQFADALGLSLASVKHFSDNEEPQVPLAVLSRLQEDAGPLHAPEPPTPKPAFHLVRDFQVTALGALRPEQRVCLERATGSEGPYAGAPQVWVLVRGPGPASVRYTFNNWLSFVDAASEGPGELLEDGVLRLCFTLYAPPSLQRGECLQFAIRSLEEWGGESWDNNGGRNYTLRYEVCPTSEPD